MTPEYKSHQASISLKVNEVNPDIPFSAQALGLGAKQTWNKAMGTTVATAGHDRDETPQGTLPQVLN